MKLSSRKLLPLALAILLGGSVIFFAWKTVSFNGGDNAVSAEGGAGEMIDAGSWREALKVIPQDSLIHLLSASAGNASSTAFATTTTDLLGRELLTSYALAQKSIGNTPMTDADAKEISGILAGKVMKDTALKEYIEEDLIVISSSTSSLATYQKALAAAFSNFAHKNTVNEIKVVYEAVGQRDASKLAPLAGSVKNLQILVNTLVAMKVPRGAEGLHLFFLNNYSLVLSGVTDMQKIVDDPVLGMRGIAKYQEGMNAIMWLAERMKTGR